MGLFSSKPQPIPPEQLTGEPVLVKIPSGPQIQLGVNVHNDDFPTLIYLLGKPRDNDDISKTVKVHICRDPASKYPDSVKVMTTEGAFIGWVVKNDSPMACGVVDSLDGQVRKREPTTRIHPLVYEVSARVEGGWQELDDDELDEDPDPDPDADPRSLRWYGWEDEMTIKIKDPAVIADIPVPEPEPTGPAGWHPDPYGRYEKRYFDGFTWTKHVFDNGVQSVES